MLGFPSWVIADQDADPPQDLTPELCDAVRGLQAAVQRHVSATVAAAEQKAARRERDAVKLVSRVEHEAQRRAERSLLEALTAAWVILEQSEPATSGAGVTPVAIIAAELAALPQAQVRKVTRAAIHKMEAGGRPRQDGERFLLRFALHEQHGGVIEEVYGPDRAETHRRMRPWAPWPGRARTP